MIADPLALRVAETIAAALAPRRIILFGSRAKGTASKDSDLDLLVVYDGGKSKREALLDIRKLFPSPDFGMDLFVMTPEEFDRQKSVANTVAREAVENGVAVYG